jgi:hypothetical protein
MIPQDGAGFWWRSKDMQDVELSFSGPLEFRRRGQRPNSRFGPHLKAAVAHATRPHPLRLVRRQAAFSLKSSGFGLLADPSGWQGWRYNFQK